MGYLTPDTIPDEKICYQLFVPNNRLNIAAFMGAVSELGQIYNWELYGEMTPADMSEAWSIIYQEMAESPDSCNMIGQVVQLASESFPENVLPCDGAQYLRVDYPKLYAVINNNLIVDTDNFKVPDLRLKFVRGATNSNIVGNTGGNNEINLSTSQLPSHTHTYQGTTLSGTLEGVGVPLPTAVINPIPQLTGGTGSGATIDIRPAYQTLLSGIVAE